MGLILRFGIVDQDWTSRFCIRIRDLDWEFGLRIKILDWGWRITLRNGIGDKD